MGLDSSEVEGWRAEKSQSRMVCHRRHTADGSLRLTCRLSRKPLYQPAVSCLEYSGERVEGCWPSLQARRGIELHPGPTHKNGGCSGSICCLSTAGRQYGDAYRFCRHSNGEFLLLQAPNLHRLCGLLLPFQSMKLTYPDKRFQTRPNLQGPSRRTPPGRQRLRHEPNRSGELDIPLRQAA